MDESLKDLVGDIGEVYVGKGFSEHLPTGIVTLDIALAGGFPLNGSLTEIWGEESHGKTTLTLRICKKCTDLGGYVIWKDTETSYDPEWAAVQGLNTERVIAKRPSHMEECMDSIIEDIRSYKTKFLPWLVDPRWKPTSEQAQAANLGVTQVDAIKEYMIDHAPPMIIAWDSLAATPVKSVAEENAEYSSGMAYRARLIKSFISRYQVAVIGCERVGMIIINQVIDNIGNNYGPALSTPGGHGLQHGKHLSIYVKKSGSGEKDAENFKITDYTMISLTKNKITSVISSFPVIFSKSRGFLGMTSVMEYLWNIGWFKTSGSWKKFDYKTVDTETGEITTEEISFQRGNFYTLMEERPELFTYLCEQIKELIVSKFPTKASLRETDVSMIVQACLGEETAVPDEEESESLTDE